MSPSLSYAELMALKPCDAYRRKDLFKNAERLTARGALAAGASISDLVWVADRLGLKRQCVEFALACAQRVAHLNTDPRVRTALGAAQAWLDNPSDPSANAAASAADNAAASAADNAYAASAAHAAHAASAAAAYVAQAAHADYAASAAANAAAKAAAYAAAAYAAALAAEKEEQKRLFLEIFDA